MPKKNKLTLDVVFVVEGKTDQSLIESLFVTKVITTNGSALNHFTLNLIKQVSQIKPVILLLDPDYQGQKIQARILEAVPNCHVCFISFQDMNPNKIKKGIAEANVMRMRNKIIALVDKIPESMFVTQHLSWEQYLELQLDNKSARIKLCQQLQIPYCNHKQLFKKLTMLNLEATKITEMINHE